MGRVPCMAKVDSVSDGTSYNLRRAIAVTVTRACKRSAVEKVGHLDLCKVHARLAREGFLTETGEVASRLDIANARKNPKRYPNGLFPWKKGL